jgi:HEAT repeat protein
MTSRGDGGGPTRTFTPGGGSEAGIVLPVGLAVHEATVLSMVDGLASLDPLIVALLQAPGTPAHRLWLAARCLAEAASRPDGPAVSNAVRMDLLAALADGLPVGWAVDGLLLLGAQGIVAEYLDTEPDERSRLALLDAIRRSGHVSVGLVRTCARTIDDPDVRIRVAVVRVVGRYLAADAELADLIEQALDDPALSVRLAALAVLGAGGPLSPEALDRVRSVASDDTPPARAAALRVLIAQTRPDDGLLDALMDATSDTSGMVRALAGAALGRLAGDAPDIVVPWLIGQIDAGGGGETVRKAFTSAARAGAAVAPFLVDAVLHGPWPVRAPAAELLGRIGTRDHAVVEALLASFDSGSELVRAAAARALGEIGADDDVVCDELLRLTSDHEPLVRQRAVEALTLLDDATDETIQACLDLLDDPDAGVRRAAVAGLTLAASDDGTIHETPILSRLAAMLRDPSVSVRRGAARTLGRVGRDEPDVVEGLVRALADLGSKIRHEATEALATLGDDDAATRVVVALRQARRTPNWIGRVPAARVLAALDQTLPDVRDDILSALTSPVTWIRRVGAKASIYLTRADPETVHALTVALSSRDSHVRGRVAAALASLGRLPPTGIPLLVAACSDREDDVRYTASEVLEQLVATDTAVATSLIGALAGPDPKATAALMARLAPKHPHLMELLVGALSDEQPPVRGGARSILFQVGQSNPGGLAIVLRRALDGGYGPIDSGVVWALLRSSESQCVSDTRRPRVALDDDDDEPRSLAEDAIDVDDEQT